LIVGKPLAGHVVVWNHCRCGPVELLGFVVLRGDYM
jgi:hypothetical protein